MSSGHLQHSLEYSLNPKLGLPPKQNVNRRNANKNARSHVRWYEWVSEMKPPCIREMNQSDHISHLGKLCIEVDASSKVRIYNVSIR